MTSAAVAEFFFSFICLRQLDNSGGKMTSRRHVVFRSAIITIHPPDDYPATYIFFFRILVPCRRPATCDIRRRRWRTKTAATSSSSSTPPPPLFLIASDMILPWPRSCCFEAEQKLQDKGNACSNILLSYYNFFITILAMFKASKCQHLIHASYVYSKEMSEFYHQLIIALHAAAIFSDLLMSVIWLVTAREQWRSTELSVYYMRLRHPSVWLFYELRVYEQF